MTQHHQIHFYDAATPENVPSGVYAAVYVNGFAWPEEEIRRMKAVIRVSVEREAFWADKARVLDIESGAAQPVDLVPFIKRRLSHGYRDATGYVNRSNWSESLERVRHAGLQCYWWVSTLDGTQDVGGGAWAVQYQGGMTAAYDLSVLHGQDTFHRP